MNLLKFLSYLISFLGICWTFYSVKSPYKNVSNDYIMEMDIKTEKYKTKGTVKTRDRILWGIFLTAIGLILQILSE